MSESPDSSLQRLPNKLILSIIDLCLASHQLWHLPNFLHINKTLRAALLSKVKSLAQVHLYDEDQLFQLINRDCSQPGSDIASQRTYHLRNGRTVQPLTETTTNTERSLFLHFICTDEDILHILKRKSWTYRKNVKTLGLEAYNFSDFAHPHIALCLWTSTLFPNLNRLIINYSHRCVLDLCGDLDDYEDKSETEFRSIIRALPQGETDSTIEALALFVPSGCSLMDDVADAIHFMPNLQRLYMFIDFTTGNFAELVGEHIEQEAVEWDLETKLNLVVQIYVDATPPTEPLDIPPPVLFFPDGLVLLGPIPIKADYRKEDMLSIMHRVIDEVEKEWAPEAFQGYHWRPTTRPHFVAPIPTQAYAEEQALLMPYGSTMAELMADVDLF